MKHFFMSLVTLGSFLCAVANVQQTVEGLDPDAVVQQSTAAPVEQTTVKNALVLDGWKCNWFAGVQGGGSAFIGDPLGCDDLFGRTRPLIRAYAGKWFTPSVGSRFVFEGLSLQDYIGKSQDYQAYHLDILWNVLGRPYNSFGSRRWSLSPYLGVGFIHTNMHYHSPFAVNYGVLFGYRISERLNLDIEISGMSTTSALDNYPGRHRWADSFAGVSFGLSYAIGKSGWQQVVDAEPYITRMNSLEEQLANQRCHNEDCAAKRRPNNNYSGLNSLRARIGSKDYGLYIGEDGRDYLFSSSDEELSAAEIENFLNNGQYINVDSIGGSTLSSKDNYITKMAESKAYIGTPVFFFFVLGKDVLVDDAQLVNLDEIAKIAKEYNLKIRIVGSADSATGNESINRNLSEKRANFILNELVNRGVKVDNISKSYVGGVDKYVPEKANRLTSLEMYF